MKKIWIAIVVFSVTAGVYAGNGEGAEELKIDTKNSKVEWLGKKVTGQHNGEIEVKEGNFLLEEGKLVGGNIVIDMQSIEVLDITDAETNGKLVGHLKSDDFFNAEKYPEATFKITEVIKIEGENKYTIKGDMTIRGITNAEEFPATVIVKNAKVAAIGEMIINRSKYDVKYGSDAFFDDLGDRMIYDDFTITFKIGAK